MKVTLEFDTSDPDQNLELKRIMKSDDMSSFIFDLLNNFHRNYKYVEENPHWEDVITKMHELAKEHNVDNMDELI